MARFFCLEERGDQRKQREGESGGCTGVQLGRADIDGAANLPLMEGVAAQQSGLGARGWRRKRHSQKLGRDVALAPSLMV